MNIAPITEWNEECSGCGACASSCPSGAITMEADNEGFLYPTVNKESCLGCGLCVKKCQSRVTKKRYPLNCYAAVSPSDDTRMCSSSGGVFSEMAENILGKSGIVFGAGFNDSWQVEHSWIDSVDDLPRLRGSKYVQSKIGDCFHEVESFLKSGKDVLFSGTPCQIAGLKSFLGKSYENLLTVEVICHGAPSPKVWMDYVSDLERSGKLISFSFREKTTGWRNYHVSSQLEGKEVSRTPFYWDIYMKAFLYNYTLRPSCYECQFKKGRSGADICLGDFWGISGSSLDDDRGVSAVMVYTQKGQQYLDQVRISKEACRYSDIAGGNPSLEQKSHRPAGRDYFWSLYYSVGLEAFYSAEEKYKPGIILRAVRKLQRIFKIES